DRVEADKVDRGDVHRLAFGDRHRQIDCILLVVELDVESGDTRVGITAVGVEGLDAFEVRIEARTIEEILAAPGDLRALTRRQRVLEAAFVDRFDTLEGKAMDLNRPFFFASGRERRGRKKGDDTTAET